MNTPTQIQPHKGIRPAAIVVFLMTIFLTGCLIALGTWQVQRLSWKLDLIAQVEARVHADPVAPPALTEWPTMTDSTAYQYRRVKLSGTYRHQDEVQVYTVSDLGPGYWVLTPLQQDDGTFVIVNRGFVPTDRRAPSTRTDAQVAGRVDVVGLMRAPETGGLFLRSNDINNNRWYSRNIAQIAEAKGLANVAPFYVDADATPNPGGLPIGGKTVLTFPNKHLSYAITWYILAAMMVAAGWYVIRNLNAPKRTYENDFPAGKASE